MRGSVMCLLESSSISIVRRRPSSSMMSRCWPSTAPNRVVMSSRRWENAAGMMSG